MQNTIKLFLIAGKSSAQPILGQYGIPIQKFTQDFNDATNHFADDLVLSVKIKQFNKKIINLKFCPNISLLLQKLSNNKLIYIQDIYLLALILQEFKSLNYLNHLLYFKNLVKTLISSIQSYLIIIK